MRLGTWMLAGVLLTALIVNIALILMTMLVRDSGPQIGQIVRVILEMLIFLFVMVGHAWARWLSVVLFGIAALVAFTSIGAMIGSDPPNVIGAVLMVVIGVLDTFFVLCLVVPSPITRYLASRRA